MFKIIVKALVLQGNKLLLVKRSGDDKNNGGELTVPGGFLNFGEKPKDAIVREVEEETNLKVDIERVNCSWSFMGEEKDVQIVGISFLCKPLTKRIKLSKELSSSEWIDVNKISKLDLPKWLIKEINQIKNY